METLRLLGGLALSWLLGVGALLALRDARRPLAAPGEIAWLGGAGYLVGAFLLTLWMRVLSFAGLRFSALSIALALATATLVLGVVGWRRHADTSVLGSLRGALVALIAPPE